MLPFPIISLESSSSGFHAHDEGASNWSRVNQILRCVYRLIKVYPRCVLAWSVCRLLNPVCPPVCRLRNLKWNPGPDRLVNSSGEFTALCSRVSRHIPGKVARNTPAALIFTCILGKEMVAVICRGEDRQVHYSSFVSSTGCKTSGASLPSSTPFHERFRAEEDDGCCRLSFRN